ncbi:MAG: phospho-sugar mutase [Acutalibacteraceae bacterium]
MKTKELYELWLNNATEDSDLIEELKSIKDNDEEIYDRFYRSLEFGTAGLRGIIGAGTNRMNIYNVRLATQGLANYLNKKYEKSSVAISYDSRIKATKFAEEAARVLAANGIKAYITKELEPTPVLSFAVRELKCQSGIMVTASHNPAAYNGYKCYGDDGCQMTDDGANAVYSEIQSVDCFKDVKLVSFEDGIKKGLIEYIDDSLYEAYLKNVEAQAVNKDICKGADLQVVYTPLNGTGNKLVREILKRTGVEKVAVVKEQELPDGNFTTCPYPNPEIKEALALGLELCDKVKPDLLLATDPDSDRVGIAAIDGNGYRLISGNETGIMLTNYILSSRKALNTLPENPIVVKTVVTSILINRICEKYGCELRNVLTGFKYIGEQILELEQKNEENRYVFGFEESYGYLAGTYVRDKDAVVASMLICEMAAYYKKQGKTLCNVIDELYEEYGYYQNTTLNFAFAGAAGMEKMQEIMSNLRTNAPKEIAGYKVIKTDDYLQSVSKDFVNNTETEITLPKSNVIAFTLENNNSVIVRPSGTEPKIKLYITAVGTDKANAADITDKLTNAGEKLLGV